MSSPSATASRRSTRLEADPPDIVLADVGMPERDGYEVAAFIKEHPELAHIPVLLLTGAFEPVDQARARAVGCDGVLVKPFEPQHGDRRVRDLLAGNRGAASAARAGAPPVAAAAPAEPAASLEDYFDRLDAALASKSASAPTLDPVPAATPAPSVAPKPSLSAVPVTGVAAATRGAHPDLDLTGWNPSTPVQPAEKAVPAAAPASPVVPAVVTNPAWDL